MGSTKKRPRTRSEVVLDTWHDLQADSAGMEELKLIQKKIQAKLGEGAEESPAAIARTLAENGVRLRHPEILEFDSRWREVRSYRLFSADELNFSTVATSLASVTNIDTLNRQFEFEGDTQGVRHLRDLVRQLRDDLEQISVGQGVSPTSRELAGEVAEWLRVWLQNPLIFADWLGLRRTSAGFSTKFGPK